MKPTQHTYYATALKSLMFIALTLSFAACSKDDDNTVETLNEAYWKISSTVNAASGSSAILITGTPEVKWSAEVTVGNTWCSFSSKDFTASSTKEGIVKEGLNVLYVYYPKNNDKEQRQAQITFQFEGKEPQVFDLIQLAEAQQNLPVFNIWSEIPERKENDNYQYVTHYVQLNNKTVRNYSICFDKSKKASLWVAYPLHSAYIGSQSRTDAWAFDPFIPSEFQADCTMKSYKEKNYDRGHQIPSADRVATYEMNAQTFYMSNMTPQLDRLNQDMWAKLETKVRSYKCSDTLYVVTGAYFGSNTMTADGAGNKVSVPTNYFKVLLRTKSGSTGKAVKDCNESELISIGFWVDHISYGNIEPPRSICKSVADIESMTGFTFFPQVSNVVKQQNNPNQWGIN